MNVEEALNRCHSTYGTIKAYYCPSCKAIHWQQKIIGKIDYIDIPQNEDGTFTGSDTNIEDANKEFEAIDELYSKSISLGDKNKLKTPWREVRDWIEKLDDSIVVAKLDDRLVVGIYYRKKLHKLSVHIIRENSYILESNDPRSIIETELKEIIQGLKKELDCEAKGQRSPKDILDEMLKKMNINPKPVGEDDVFNF